MGWWCCVQELRQRSGRSTKGEAFCQWHAALGVPQEIYGEICEVKDMEWLQLLLVLFSFFFSFLWSQLSVSRIIDGIQLHSVFKWISICTVQKPQNVVYKWVGELHLCLSVGFFFLNFISINKDLFKMAHKNFLIDVWEMMEVLVAFQSWVLV